MNRVMAAIVGLVLLPVGADGIGGDSQSIDLVSDTTVTGVGPVFRLYPESIQVVSPQPSVGSEADLPDEKDRLVPEVMVPRQVTLPDCILDAPDPAWNIRWTDSRPGYSGLRDKCVLGEIQIVGRTQLGHYIDEGYLGPEACRGQLGWLDSYLVDSSGNVNNSIRSFLDNDMCVWGVRGWGGEPETKEVRRRNNYYDWITEVVPSELGFPIDPGCLGPDAWKRSRTYMECRLVSVLDSPAEQEHSWSVSWPRARWVSLGTKRNELCLSGSLNPWGDNSLSHSRVGVSPERRVLRSGSWEVRIENFWEKTGICYEDNSRFFQADGSLQEGVTVSDNGGLQKSISYYNRLELLDYWVKRPFLWFISVKHDSWGTRWSARGLLDAGTDHVRLNAIAPPVGKTPLTSQEPRCSQSDNARSRYFRNGVPDPDGSYPWVRTWETQISRYDRYRGCGSPGTVSTSFPEQGWITMDLRGGCGSSQRVPNQSNWDGTGTVWVCADGTEPIGYADRPTVEVSIAHNHGPEGDIRKRYHWRNQQGWCHPSLNYDTPLSFFIPGPIEEGANVPGGTGPLTAALADYYSTQTEAASCRNF